MEEKLVSVIVPVYNVEKYVSHCLESILGQTYQNFEVLLVDDGSTDQSGSLCDQLGERDPRIHVFHKENGGLSDARNYGIERAKGEYFAFIDSDDYVDSEYLKTLCQNMEKEDADIVVCGHYLQDGKKLSLSTPVLDQPLIWDRFEAMHRLLQDDQVRNYAWDKLYKRKLFQEVRYPKGRNFEDVATTYKLFERAEKIVCIPDHLYYYVMRGDSISSNVSDQRWLRNCLTLYENEKARQEDLIAEGDCYFGQKEKEILVGLAETGWVTYALTHFRLAVKLKDKEAMQRTLDFLKKEEEGILQNPYVDPKEKKLLKVYLSPIGKTSAYEYAKNGYNWVKNLSWKVQQKAKNHLKNRMDFTLTEGASLRFVLFELECFDNLGDHAIAYAQEKYLRDYIERTQAEKGEKIQLFKVMPGQTQEAVQALKKVIGEKDVLFLQGGGNLGSLYSFATAERSHVLETFPRQPIFIFPQTIYFAQDEEGNRVKKKEMERYARCQKLTIFARDAISQAKMKETFPRNRVVAMNDIVSSLQPALTLGEAERQGILLCLRADQESALGAKEKIYLLNQCKTLAHTDVSDTCRGAVISPEEREVVLQEKWKFFAQHKLVVTDRLHGMIFAMITQTPCIILGNNHHKVEATYHTFQDCRYLRYAKDPEEAAGLLKEMYESRENGQATQWKFPLAGLLNSLLFQEN